MSGSNILPSTYFLLVHFGEIVSNFYLISYDSEYKLSIYGPIEILTSILETSNGQKYFEQGIADLENIAGRKLFKHKLLLILDSPNQGVSGVSFVGKKDMEKNIEVLTHFTIQSFEDAFKSTVQNLEKIGGSVSILDVGVSNIYYGQCENGTTKLRVLENRIRELLMDMVRGKFDLERVKKWLPYETNLNILENYLANKMVYPQTIPLTNRDLALEHAFYKEVIKETHEKNFFNSNNLKRIVLSGSSLRKTSSDEQAMMMAVDGLELKGISNIYVDKLGLSKLITELIKDLPVEQQQLLYAQIIKHQVTVVTVSGPMMKGKKVGNLVIDQDLQNKQEVVLEGGALHYLPITGAMKLKFSLLPGYTIFESQLNGKSKSDRNMFEVGIIGGEKGIIIDLRGRPLIPYGGEEGRKQIRLWNESMDIYQNIQKIILK